ncbi:hypothetical protein CAPTEDRAFT_91899 [Capitella teleta]|uniref:Protein HTATIP2 n=1 Tax=Capitella teleta TaxID=283909 RepID=R7V1X9_CAPTE|nr:hypothetical protein CAPTEDRAFT_91899 [Capitella teleta]|eukprot:ELU12853.1 hypothetical protein CAPTEDRAFT_91899 [Capitella teleta]
MAQVNFADLREEFKAKNQSAFVVGYTGETGKALVEEMISSNVFSKIVLIGRRKVEYEDVKYKDIAQEVIDFDKIEDYADSFKGIDQGFCLLGTTRGKAGADGFYKVDHDYVVGVAKLAKEGGCSHFHLMSSMGANKSSANLYAKTKGQVEAEIEEMNFDRFSYYRPGLLLCNRQESRRGEYLIKVLTKPITFLFPTLMSNPVEDVAKAMINQACSAKTDNKVKLFNIKDIYRFAEH